MAAEAVTWAAASTAAVVAEAVLAEVAMVVAAVGAVVAVVVDAKEAKWAVEHQGVLTERQAKDHLALAVPVAVVAVGAAPWGLGLSAATEAGMAVATEAGTVVGSVVVMVVVMEVGMQVVGLAGEVMEEAAPVVGVPVAAKANTSLLPAAAAAAAAS